MNSTLQPEALGMGIRRTGTLGGRVAAAGLMRCLFGVSLCLGLACAPRLLTEGVRCAAEKFNVADASAVPVSGRAYLRLDADLRADLDELLAMRESLPKGHAGDLLRGATELSTAKAMDELDRMPPLGLTWLVTHYGTEKQFEDTELVRRILKDEYRKEAKRNLNDDLALLAGEVNERNFLLDLRSHLQALPGDRGRTTRTILTAPLFVPAIIGAEIADAEAVQRSMVADFVQTIAYCPKSAPSMEHSLDLMSLASLALAAQYAPIFIQQMNPDAPYETVDDRIGRVHLSGHPNDIQVNVDTIVPVVYWTSSHARINQRYYEQLTYVAWYPSRPALSAGDVQAGNIDGVVVRITLDRHRRPSIYEFVRTCGCYHTLWVAEFVEAAARSEFGPPDAKRKFTVQPASATRSLFIPALVPDDGTTPRRPVVFIDAGNHMVVSIQPSEPEEQTRVSNENSQYLLEPYDSLTRLPLGNAVASMFGSDGLVHKAGRKEGVLLAPTGMLSPGQPRQLGTMKIRMDAYDHDDPHLLEKNLRLPSNF